MGSLGGARFASAPPQPGHHRYYPSAQPTFVSRRQVLCPAVILLVALLPNVKHLNDVSNEVGQLLVQLNLLFVLLRQQRQQMRERACFSFSSTANALAPQNCARTLIDSFCSFVVC